MVENGGNGSEPWSMFELRLKMRKLDHGRTARGWSKPVRKL